MKTAEEIKDSILFEVGRYLEHRSPAILGDAIKSHLRAFQLDAMKEGMRRASERCSGMEGDDCAENILAAAEQLTEKDL